MNFSGWLQPDAQ